MKKNFVAVIVATMVFCMNTTTAMAAPATQPNTGAAATTSIAKVSLEASKDAKVVADGTSNIDTTTPASLVTAKDSEDYTVSFAWAAIEANKTVGGDVYPEAIVTKDNPAYVFNTDYAYYVLATFTAKEGKDFNGEVNLDVNVEGCVAKKDATQMLVYVPIAFGTSEGEAQEQKEEAPQTSAGIKIEINNNGNNNNNNNAIVIGNGNTVSITNGNDATSNSNSATGSKNLKIRGKVVKSSNGKAVVKIRWNKISGASSYYLSDESGDIEEETSKKSVKITLKEGTVYTLTLEALDKNDDVIAEVEKTIKVSDGKLMAKK